MLHELWTEEDEGGVSWTFCLAGALGDQARSMLGPAAALVWTVEAESHFEAMTAYYEHMGWGTYTSDFPDLDRRPYAEGGPG